MKNKIVVFALIAMVGMFAAGCGDTSSSQAGSASTEPAGVSAASVSSETPASSTASEGVTAEKYEQVKLGSTKEEVEKILGKGESSSSDETAGVKTESFTYKTSDPLAYASVMFQNGKAVSKDQVGLYDNSKFPKITLEQYDKVSTGMTYDQVKSALGGDGEPSTESNFGGIVSKGYYWPGKEDMSFATLTFDNDGKLTAKNQVGLN